MSDFVPQFCHLEEASVLEAHKTNEAMICENRNDCKTCEGYGRVCTFAAKMAGDAAEAALARLKKDCPNVFHTDHPLENVSRIRKDSVILGKKLGRGGYCSVYAAAHKKEDVKDEDMTLALKRLKRQIMIRPRDLRYGAMDLASEAAFLAHLDHPNIIRLHGIADGESIHECIERTDYHDDGDGFFIVVDRLAETLDRRIQHWRAQEASQDSTFFGFSHTAELQGLHDRLRSALQIAQAIEYLHSLGIMFRDIKPDNVGFDEEGTVKLFDFGLATSKKESTEMAGSRRYMAPEVIKGRLYRASVDVYSFGILLWEMSAMERPFEDYTCIQHQYKVVEHHERPKLFGWWPRALQRLMQQCWSRNPKVRPPMHQVVATLQDILRDYDTAQEQQHQKKRRSLRRKSDPKLSSSPKLVTAW